MDLDPFAPLGITAPTMRLLDLFLLHCLLSDSPNDTPEELQAVARNKLFVAQRGREPGLLLAARRRAGRAGASGDRRSSRNASRSPRRSTPRTAARPTATRSPPRSALARAGDAPSARVLHAMARNHGNSTCASSSRYRCSTRA